MIIPFIFFIISLLGIVAMLILGLHKEKTGKAYVFFSQGHKTDHAIRQKWQVLRQTASLVTVRNTRIVARRVLDTVEAKSVRTKDWI